MSSPRSRVIKKETFEVQFDDFESLPKRKGQDFVESAKFTWFGRQWSLRIYPGGHADSMDGKVCIALVHESNGNIEVEITFTVKISTPKIAVRQDLGKRNFDDNLGRRRCWAAKNFASRPTLIGALQGGSLVIDVMMKHADRPYSPFVPENPLCRNILNKFMDEESADVVFQVGIGNGTFYAHQFLLRECSPVLAELCKSEGDLTPIPIPGIKPEIFRHVLRNVYGGKVDDDDLKANSRDLIEAADRFGVVNLKLEAEACYVKTTNISMDNMMQNLVYAHDNNCPLLKEAVMDFIVENGIDIEEKVSLEDVPSGLLVDLAADLLNAVNRERKNGAGGGHGTELSMMSVDDLRKKLHEEGLDVDGSRKAMVAALKETS